MRRSLTADLVVWAALSLVVATFLALATWSLLAHFSPERARHRDLQDALARLQVNLEVGADGRPTERRSTSRHALMYQLLSNDVVYQVVSADGKVLMSSNGDVTPLVSDPAQLHEDGVMSVSRYGNALYAMAQAWKPADRPWFIVVARSDRFEKATRDFNASTARQSAVSATVLSMSIFAIVVVVIVNRLLRRLRATSAAAALIVPSNLAARLDLAGVPTEIAPLIESFNAALERLEAGFRNQQEFLAMAAHELKTPIALLRAQIELDGAVDHAGMLADLDHMSRHVHQLLHLAEVSDVASMAPVKTDVGDVVGDAVGALARMTVRQGVEVRVEDGGELVLIDADPSGLFILVRNLLENAIVHSPAGAAITVRIASSGLSVTDQGAGIPPEDRPMLFKRFWRGEHRLEEGAGLGLAICSEIARAHGWTITGDNGPTAGAIFSVLFEP